MLEYDPSVVAYEELLEIFWKTHDPTQVRLQYIYIYTATLPQQCHDLLDR